jgi:cephalosporin hydroxylase
VSDKQDPVRAAFEEENRTRAALMHADESFADATRVWMNESVKHKYSYHFTWLGRPIIQYPQDLVAMQEAIWHAQPDAVIETGVAWGGSLVFHASMLKLLGGPGRVLGVDIEIRPHNRAAIVAHPMADRIDLIEGSSIDRSIVAKVAEWARPYTRPMVILDSNHTHDHVLAELELYSGLVRKDGYLIVCDTVIEELPPEAIASGRPWGKGNNPMTAVDAFLRTNDRFVLDDYLNHKLLITVAPRGYLRCVKD